MNERDLSRWQEFSGPNAAYLADLYDRFRADPESVDPETRRFFEGGGAPPVEAVAPARVVEAASPGAAAAAPAVDVGHVAGAAELATAIRAYGYRAARLDPLGS